MNVAAYVGGSRSWHRGVLGTALLLLWLVLTSGAALADGSMSGALDAMIEYHRVKAGAVTPNADIREAEVPKTSFWVTLSPRFLVARTDRGDGQAGFAPVSYGDYLREYRIDSGKVLSEADVIKLGKRHPGHFAAVVSELSQSDAGAKLAAGLYSFEAATDWLHVLAFGTGIVVVVAVVLAVRGRIRRTRVAARSA